MSALGWFFVALLTWFCAGFVLALALGRLLAPPWWEQLADDIEALPTTNEGDTP